MALPQSGPTNLEQGNRATFCVEFISSAGTRASPASGSLVVAYTNVIGSTQTDTVALVNIDQTFVGTWSSTNAELGIANYSVTIGNSPTPTLVGYLRIIERDFPS